MFRPSLFAFFFLLPLVAVPCRANDSWASVPRDPAGTVTVTDDLVVHERSDGSVDAFGSSARSWRALGGAGSEVLGVGARTVLVRDGASLHAYAASRDGVATLALAPGASATAVGVGDDVALVLVEQAGTTSAHAFSAPAGAWFAQVLTGPVGDAVVGGRVAGLAVGSRYLGFAANVGVWAAFDGAFGGAALSASGDVLVVDQRATGGPITNALAFSGTRGCWAASPPLTPGTPIALDDAVAGVVAAVPNGIVAAAYSSPRATWVVSARTYVAPPSIASARGVLGVLNAAGGLVEVFGAEHAAWAEPSATLPAGTFALGGDAVVGCDPAADVVEGFSALIGGGFVQRSKPVGASSTFHTGAHLCVLELDRGPWTELHAFCPSLGSFASPLVLAPNAPIFVGDSVVHAVGSAALGYALAARDGVWRGLGTVLPDGTIGSTVAVGGSVVVHQSSDGTVNVYDERCAAWNPTFDQGAVHTHTAAGNVVLATPESSTQVLLAYSSLRGAWVAEPSAVAPVGEPRAGANVAACVDAAGDLWAFGATNDTRALRAWPVDDDAPLLGSHPFAPPFAPACYDDVLRLSARGRAGEVSLMLLAPFAACPPETIAGIAGELWLSSATTQVLAPVGVHAADGVAILALGLGGARPGVAVRAHVQALFVDLATFEVRFGDRRSEAVTLH